MTMPLSDHELSQLLSECKRIAVVGLSPDPSRPSFEVTRYMIKNGYTIFGIRPGSPDRILDRPAYSSLLELKEPVDIIDVFRSSDAIPDVVADIETWMKSFPSHQRPRLLWLQEGVTNPIAEEKAETLGLKVISNRCILKERVRLFGHAK